jgi:hypothetical protein
MCGSLASAVSKPLAWHSACCLANVVSMQNLLFLQDKKSVACLVVCEAGVNFVSRESLNDAKGVVQEKGRIKGDQGNLFHRGFFLNFFSDDTCLALH